MWRKKLALIAVIAFAGCALAEDEDYEPMVAFICNKGAMHMDPDNGWTSDRLTDCLEKKDDILAYCKKAYPTRDITNIVEASEAIDIKGWCPTDKKKCKHPQTYKVTPYRCLSGPFQSDALVVPRTCVFDHIHNGVQCQGYDWWADVAKKSCTGLHKMNTESYAMLLPCGTDVFTGVEFVCCPEDKGDAEERSSEESSEESLMIVPSIEVKVKRPDETEAVSIEAEDTVSKYLHQNDLSEYRDEHDAFTLAKKQLLKKNHDKTTKLMKDWEEARSRVINMKTTDPKQAEKLNREITSRFQKEYFALQTEGDAKQLQLDSVHQQHVQTNLNTKKRATMEKLMTELQAEFYDPESIMKYLQKYISVEQKDAHHCIQHYLKIRDRDANAAEQLLPATLEHLTLISTRINQSIDLIHQLDDEKVANKIESSIRAWLSKSYSDLDKTINTLTQSAPIAPKKTGTAVPDIKVDIKPVGPETNKEPTDVNSVGQDNGMSMNMYKKYAQKLAETDFGKKDIEDVKKPRKLEAPEKFVKDFIKRPPVKVVYDEENEKENEHNLNNMVASQQNAQASGINYNQAVNGGVSAATAVAIAIGMIAAVLVVVLAIVVMRRKSQSRGHPPTNTYLEVAIESPDMDSAEDKHIASMQNGYENPTYRLLEQKKV